MNQQAPSEYAWFMDFKGVRAGDAKDKENLFI